MQNPNLVCGNATAILPTLETASFDALITDPPYSSGGLHRGDKSLSTSKRSTKALRRERSIQAETFQAMASTSDHGSVGAPNGSPNPVESYGLAATL